ncbi:hypothetical protein EXIGLDRAFT_839327 [Exidia glandulosa HHB12029]|uniref:Activator of Hsp90 ATPase AHSA1-like N-terminal domain-containing protein n=1 Tax=Exidia glandulosa HHB12029 TaxID=1314781 RepID=A0A165F3C7_EXIGL|nr:hypothetical protein EXIGLDRAFT_839327 [Exidia glandulosa HHB12029]
MASSFVANYHWKSKGVKPWADDWFKRELPTLSLDGDAGTVKIDQVTEIDGDAELGNRKAKLLAIFDCKIELDWSGTTKSGEDVKGTLVIPEVSHETALDQISDYVYNWTLKTPSTKEVDALFAFARKQFPPVLEAKFAKFPVELLETHGGDLTVKPSSNDPSRNGTPAPAGASSYAPAPPAPSAAAAAPTKPKPKATNTSSVTVEASFMASADDLFGLLTDEKRIPMWSRAPAQSNVEAGGSFSLFGGGVKGTYASLNRPTQFVQNWMLDNPKWPDGHTATLTTSLEQSSESTTLKLALNGVPKGMEDEITNNLQGYYIRGLKSIGYVEVARLPPPRRASPPPPPAQNALQRQWLALAFAALAIVGAFALPLFTSSPTSRS